MEPIEYLFGLELHGIKLGLENIRSLLTAAGNPQYSYPTVHVAGTNGKGSVIAILDAVLRTADYRTGRFTSPHLVSVSERFQIDGRPIEPAALDAQIDWVQRAAEEKNLVPTFFEANTAIAFRHFAEQEVDIALVEVGMGGRFDSTNVINPLATAITNIGLEHTAYLGDTLAKIAFEKAGVLKPNVPVVTAESNPEALEVILDRASEERAPVALAGRDYRVSVAGPVFEQTVNYESASLRIHDAPLALAGRHQAENAGVAIGLAEVVREGLPRVDEASIRSGLATARWPCRLERFGSDPEIVIDVAHNEAGAKVLAEAMDGPYVLLLAVASDKNAEGILAALAGDAREIVLSQFSNRRAYPVSELQDLARGFSGHCIEDLGKAMEFGISRARELALPLVIAGSLFLAGEARQLLERVYGAPPLSF